MHRLPPAPLQTDALDAALAPFGQSRMLPAAVYVAPEVLAWERRHLFDGGWVCAGRIDTARSPGRQVAVRMGDTSVLLVTDALGELGAFANICRHRGHELLACGASIERGVVQCPYHAWSYELDGRLRLAPHLGDVANFVPDELALVRLRHEVWNGWVFVNVSGDAPPFASWIGGLDALLAPWDIGNLRVGATHHYDLAANWKLAIENYHECYHCPLIHPELSRVSDPTSGENYVDRPGLWVGGAMSIEDRATTMSLDGGSPLAPLPGLSASERRKVVYVGLLPNLLISAHPDYVMTHRIEPTGPATSRVECQWLFAPNAFGEARFDPAFAVDFWDVTNRQDWQAVESVQRATTSSKYVPGLLTHTEDAVYQWVTMMASAYRGAPVARGRLPTDYAR
jgi:Rieske 2Fe-2S family protein